MKRTICIFANIIVVMMCALLLIGCGGAKKESLETYLLAEIQETLLPVDPYSEQSPELPEEYAEYEQEKTERETFLETYLSLIELKMDKVNKDSAQVTISTPNIAEILVSAVSEADDNTSSSEIEATMTEMLLSDECPMRSESLSLTLQETADGNVSIEKSEEYWNAVYGGLFTLTKETLAELEG